MSKKNIGFTIMLKDSIPQVEEMTFRKELEAEPYTKKQNIFQNNKRLKS